ncbi:MAG: Iron hydrogenase 1 [Deltaproteobacteria bacterium ADurb.Bin510]|nr:MAG: Iron hydrogenase 1 [Deltaproteobacteria bacterium ADurb.Bin510]
MDSLFPIFTVAAECQDCYKCVRQCPVKAIRVTNGHATVIPELCVACGGCVTVCPAHAKQVRDDLKRVQRLIAGGQPVIVSLAPSWVSAWPDLEAGGMIAALKALGFSEVSETALGAQAVSSAVAEMLVKPGLLISSACPAAVEFISRYLPAFSACVTPLASPLMAHARQLKERCRCRVVFIGPCIAKKLEADRDPGLIDAVLTFEDLGRWFGEAGIEPRRLPAQGQFYPEPAAEGALYPIEGGMNETVRARAPQAEYVSLTGLGEIERALRDFDSAGLDKPVLLECLACEGGCVQGPCLGLRRDSLSGILAVRRKAVWPSSLSTASASARLGGITLCAPLKLKTPDENAIRAALRQLGKTCPADELNCGGCGYESCRQLAAALIAGQAEPEMCVSHMREIAHRKANALLRCMPSGVAIVAADLRIIECNRRFAEIFGEQTRLAFEAVPGMAGAMIGRILPLEELYRAALESGQDIVREHYDLNELKLNITVFTIEPQATIGVIVQDVTESELRRDQIARKAREVIQKNLVTVQEIACRLGEHMADTEILLNSIVQDYGKGEDE